MDVLTDKEMLDSCTNVSQIYPRHMGCTDAPPSPHDKWGTYGIGGTYRCIRGMRAYGCMGVYRCMGIWTPPMLTTPTCLPLNKGKISLFKAKFLHLKSWKNN